jgi:hypothetical protein
MSEEISYADAQRYPGGIEKFLFDKVMELDGKVAELDGKINSETEQEPEQSEP